MKIKIAVLGATGTVGQKVIKMLDNHSAFEITELVASEKRAGCYYEDIVHWREEGDIPEPIKKIKLINFAEVKNKFAISSLPADIAKIAEPFLTKNGTHVVSNASSYRRDPLTPLMIPEINGDHLQLIHEQSSAGKLITNPNCSTVFLSLALHPLKKLGTIKHVSVVTLQALSGAGYPGVSSLDIIGNIIPNIGGEEEKIEWEVKKILGDLKTPADFSVTAHVHRVPVIHGHTICMHVTFEENISKEQVESLFHELAKNRPELYKLHTDEFRPQPLKDITPFDERAHIGRIKQGGMPNIIGLTSMGHNLVRGAAGAAILNLIELNNFLKDKK